MQQFNKLWFFWLILVIIWNYGWPEVDPFYDVLIAILLSVIIFNISKIKKNN
jgi:hypothetical protein